MTVRAGGRAARGLLAGLVLALAACAAHPRIGARIVDEGGRPIPGAVLYVETARPGPEPDDAADFAWAEAGAAGEAPPVGTAPVTVTLPWRGMASVAAVAEGFLPRVVHLRKGDLGEVLGLEEIRLEARRGAAGTAGLESLSWPTFRRGDLRAKSRLAEHAGLRAALGKAWEEAARGGALSEGERRKLEAQRALAAPAP